MKRLIGSMLAVLWAAGLTSGCAENVPEIYIVANQPFTDECEPPAPNAGGNTLVFRSSGVLDLGIKNDYWMALRLENTLVESESVEFSSSRGGGAQGMSGADWEASHISLTHATIEFDVPEGLGVNLPSRITLDQSGRIEPGGRASMGINVIEGTIAQVLSSSELIQAGIDVTITLRIKFFGETAAGRKVGSNEFRYPLQLCRGCLIAFPPAAIDPDYPVPLNCQNFSSFDAEGQSVCFGLLGQDQPVDCRHVCPLLDPDATGICGPN